MTQYIGIHSEGGLIPYDVLDKIAQEDSGLGQQAKDFGLPAGRRLTDEISRAWSDAQDYWHIFQRRSSTLPPDESGATLTRKWISDLLELVGYELPLQQAGVVIGGKNYPISHRAGASEDSPPVQIEGFRADLDKRPQARRLSPQALIQEFLNNSDSQLWGIVTNGVLLRLLRDTSRTSRPSYLEFNLESILEGNRFNEFALFYRVCHRTRLPRTAEDSTSCWMERYFQLSIEQGGRVRDKLRDGVEDALKTLGTGFLRHPSNGVLRDRVKAGTLTAAEFHRELLRLVYRLLFLMVAEERRMIVPEGPQADRRQSLFDRYYSVGRLRGLAEKPIEASTFGDLWIGLRQTFVLFEDGDSNPLGVPPLNGDLFSAVAVKDLQATHLYNDVLLSAMQRLSLFEDHRVRQRVNYSALDVEELGSVYESLLDFQPAFAEQPEGMNFELRTGSERKSTGSYYTRPELVRELIESALVPVMQDRLAGAKDSDPAKDREKKQQAILSISVCDPACGSGHFLLAAARRLGRELAKVRTGEDEPIPKEFHLAVRDVISHCVYGVDVNPLAVDLCKLALWLEGHWTGKPLSFLDHRIKLGNSLVGVLNMDVLKEGIPDEAFSPVAGDDKKVASAFKKRNRDERKGQPSLPFEAIDHIHQYAKQTEQFDAITENSPADVRSKKEAYERARKSADWWHDWVAANLWTASFFLPLTKYDDPVVPTHDNLRTYLLHSHVNPQMEASAISMAIEVRFFHWQLEFPEVFEKHGFDVILGNPPWETIKLSEQEHWIDDEYISRARNQAERRKRIEEYRKADDKAKTQRVAKFDSEKHSHDAIAVFSRFSSRFPLTAVGDINTYALFAELGWNLSNSGGRVGILVPTGIATDEGCKNFFRAVADRKSLVTLFDFENREGLFPEVDSRMKFCAITLSTKAVHKADFAFFLTNTVQLEDKVRRFTLTPEELSIFNPNTCTCPVFRTKHDALLARKLYSRLPVFINEVTAANPFGVELCRMFHMSDDADLFSTSPLENYVALYEAKLFHQFDHRWATYEHDQARDVTYQEKTDPAFSVTPRYWVPVEEVAYKSSDVPPKLVNAVREESEDQAREVLLLWLDGFLGGSGKPGTDAVLDGSLRSSPWLLEVTKQLTSVTLDDVESRSLQVAWPLCEDDLREVADCRSFLEAGRRLMWFRCPRWFLAFRNIARSTDERTVIAGFLPFVGIANNAARIKLRAHSCSNAILLYANLNSLVFDYCARQKAGGANLNYFIIQQLPIIPPQQYTTEDVNQISQRVIELIYTSADLGAIGSEAGVSSPFKWEEDRRARIRSEIDAYYAHLYGLTREELRYVLDPHDIFGDEFPGETFRVLKENEIHTFGEYRTQRLLLEAFDALAESPRFRDEMPKRASAFNIPEGILAPVGN